MRERNEEQQLGQGSTRARLFGATTSGTLWCLHCERTYPENGYREFKDRAGEVWQMCPYEDCNGDAVIDAWAWEEVRARRPDFPIVPEKGVAYPMQ